MIPNNNLSVLPWYTSIEQQNARKWWVYNRIYPLFTPATYMLPFQIMRNHSIVGGGQSFSQGYYFQKTDSRLVKDKAQVTRLLGRTWVWNQLVQNGDFSNSSTGWYVQGGSISVANNKASFTISSISSCGIRQNISTLQGHKYYISSYLKTSSTNNNNARYVFSDGAVGNEEAFTLYSGTTQRYSTIITCTRNWTRFYIITPNIGSTVSVGDVWEYSSVFIVDLTQMFGEGNEPTITEFEALFPNGYYPYNAHKFLNNSATGIKTNGFNQWDEEWELGIISQGQPIPDNLHIRTKNFIRVLPNTLYYTSYEKMTIYFYDASKNYIGSNYIQAGTHYVNTPSNCEYIKFVCFDNYGTTYNHDICINFSDASRNGQYEPYHESTMELPITTATGKLNGKGESILLFPNGLCGIDDDRDEMDNTTAIRRLGIRAYREGDENDSSVRTDGTNTIYVLSAPEHYVLDEEYAMLFDANRYGTQLALPVQTEEPTMTPLYSEVAPYQLISLFKIFKANGEEVGDFTSQLEEQLRIKTFDALGYDVIINQGNFPFISAFPNGQYYAMLNDGKQTWYSEIFTAVNDIEPYLKIEWFDTEDFIMDAGVIVYKNPNFKNVLYLDSELAKPEYPFEEEGENRDGYFFPNKQISGKHYRFKFFASEYLLDVMRFIRMADYVKVIYRGQTYNLDTFLITPEWEDNGDVASVEAEFDTATVAKKIGRGYVVPTAGGNFNDDFNNDFNN